MADKIHELIEKIDRYTEKLKEAKSDLKDLIEDSDMYRSIYESTVSTVDENGFEVTEKDASSHAYKVTVKNFKRMKKD
jgi:hypothetical protein